MTKFKDFEDYLMDKFAQDYTGLDDEMPDAFDDWICGLDTDDWITYGDLYAKRMVENDRLAR